MERFGKGEAELYFAHKGASVKVVTKAVTESHYHLAPRGKAIEDLSPVRAAARGSCVKRNSTSFTKRAPLREVLPTRFDSIDFIIASIRALPPNRSASTERMTKRWSIQLREKFLYVQIFFRIFIIFF